MKPLVFLVYLRVGLGREGDQGGGSGAVHACKHRVVVVCVFVLVCTCVRVRPRVRSCILACVRARACARIPTDCACKLTGVQTHETARPKVGGRRAPSRPKPVLSDAAESTAVLAAAPAASSASPAPAPVPTPAAASAPPPAAAPSATPTPPSAGQGAKPASAAPNAAAAAAEKAKPKSAALAGLFGDDDDDDDLFAVPAKSATAAGPSRSIF